MLLSALNSRINLCFTGFELSRNLQTQKKKTNHLHSVSLWFTYGACAYTRFRAEKWSQYTFDSRIGSQCSLSFKGEPLCVVVQPIQLAVVLPKVVVRRQASSINGNIKLVLLRVNAVENTILNEKRDPALLWSHPHKLRREAGWWQRCINQDWREKLLTSSWGKCSRTMSSNRCPMVFFTPSYSSPRFITVDTSHSLNQS